MKRIILVDRQKLFAEGIASLLEKSPNWKVIDIFHDGAEAIREVPGRYADLLIMSLDLAHQNGLEACKAIHKLCPKLPIILWESYWSSDLLRIARKNGAGTILSKDISFPELAYAVELSIRGSHYFSPSITEYLLNS
ncbi:MAG: response regulator transcription factor [Bacteroidia bacterium]|nr:response regulator transcription factor [Bacteroidia bacterium]